MTTRPYSGCPASDFRFEFIRYEKSGYRATITFNRPEVFNCVNGPMLREISEALRDVSYDDAIAVLVLTGAGEKAFCTGADLKEQHSFLERPRDYYKWMADFIECHDRLRNLGKPSLARLNGMVVGGGNEFNSPKSQVPSPKSQVQSRTVRFRLPPVDCGLRTVDCGLSDR